MDTGFETGLLPAPGSGSVRDVARIDLVDETLFSMRSVSRQQVQVFGLVIQFRWANVRSSSPGRSIETWLIDGTEISGPYPSSGASKAKLDGQTLDLIFPDQTVGGYLQESPDAPEMSNETSSPVLPGSYLDGI
ncbi:hypothetical protein TNCT_380661 [Trichonephila clavata]|uniref:Uncharacterized protein n=1 Tax=Trichonephila clavata TaxID=2740835 RepID=A0A8X6EYV5_TRICU|nr:hypothetical protein TNCT_380661 [Trichonephila clavata]